MAKLSSADPLCLHCVRVRLRLQHKKQPATHQPEPAVVSRQRKLMFYFWNGILKGDVEPGAFVMHERSLS